MSAITRDSDAGLEGNAGQKVTPLTAQAGVELSQGGIPVYLDSNGVFQLADADVLEWSVTGSYRKPKFVGLTARAIPSGTFGEAYGLGAEFHYAASGLVIGAPAYLSSTAGGLDTAPANDADAPVATCVSATNIRLTAGV